ncbi:hypothetical protein [Coleofasciculus sp.]|uniref:hypothetical protein n=1 Tax=Coleofasciculus sp. TaxID=3100458 RepID=UPI003A15B233
MTGEWIDIREEFKDAKGKSYQIPCINVVDINWDHPQQRQLALEQVSQALEVV